MFKSTKELLAKDNDRFRCALLWSVMEHYAFDNDSINDYNFSTFLCHSDEGVYTRLHNMLLDSHELLKFPFADSLKDPEISWKDAILFIFRNRSSYSMHIRRLLQESAFCVIKSYQHAGVLASQYYDDLQLLTLYPLRIGSIHDCINYNHKHFACGLVWYYINDNSKHSEDYSNLITMRDISLYNLLQRMINMYPMNDILKAYNTTDVVELSELLYEDFCNKDDKLMTAANDIIKCFKDYIVTVDVNDPKYSDKLTTLYFMNY